jgi:hypothetical protein
MGIGFAAENAKGGHRWFVSSEGFLWHGIAV